MTAARRYPCATPGCPAERQVYTENGRREPFVVYPNELPGPPDMLCVWCRRAVIQGQPVAYGIERATQAQRMEQAHTERMLAEIAQEPVKPRRKKAA